MDFKEVTIRETTKTAKPVTNKIVYLVYNKTGKQTVAIVQSYDLAANIVSANKENRALVRVVWDGSMYTSNYTRE